MLARTPPRRRRETKLRWSSSDATIVLHELPDLCELFAIELITHTAVRPDSLGDEASGHELFNGTVDFLASAPDALFQQPPVRDSFTGVLCIGMFHQVSQDLVRDSKLLSVHGQLTGNFRCSAA